MYASDPYASANYGATPHADSSSEGPGAMPAGGGGFYGRLQATAARLLRLRASGVVTLIRQVRSANSADPLKPFDVTEVQVARDCVVTGYSQQLIDGTRIVAGDRRVLMSAASLTTPPTADDHLMIDGKRHQIIAVTPVLSAGPTPVLYVLQARTLG